MGSKESNQTKTNAQTFCLSKPMYSLSLCVIIKSHVLFHLGPRYEWTQSLEDVTMSLRLDGVKSDVLRNIDAQFTDTDVTIKLTGIYWHMYQFGFFLNIKVLRVPMTLSYWY